MKTNPVKEQDRAFDLYDTYKKYGYVMFPQQRQIYKQLAEHVARKTVLEVGCGNGVGSAMLARTAKSIVAADNIPGNVDFAKELYPWITFVCCNIERPINHVVQDVVAVEVIEHVAYPCAAIQNMLNCAIETVWISTPNGTNKPRPPENSCHVCEYTPSEMLDMIDKRCLVSVLAWDDFRPLPFNTDVSPLVYRIDL